MWKITHATPDTVVPRPTKTIGLFQDTLGVIAKIIRRLPRCTNSRSYLCNSQDNVRMEPSTLIGIAVNIVSSISIVLTNKFIYSKLGFTYMVTMSALHFLTTALAMRVLLRFKFFEFKTAPIEKMLPVALGGAASVGFMNLSLANNSVGFYQISKLMCIPVTAGLEYSLRGKVVSNEIKLTLGVILVGVGISTVSDFSLNFVGSVYAALAVAATAICQVFISSLQKDLGMNAMQLLYNTTPIIALSLLVMAPMLENVFSGENTLVEFMINGVSVEAIGYIGLTCILAIFVNFSNFLIIGKAGAITYQVIGHLKTCTILIMGFVIFGYPVIFKNVMGIVIAVGGMMVYSELKRRENSPPSRNGYSRVADLEDPNETELEKL